jgi:hypothetical protein
MALNYLLHRHQVAEVLSRSGASSGARASHRDLAAGYAAQIKTLREEQGATPVATHRVT